MEVVRVFSPATCQMMVCWGGEGGRYRSGPPTMPMGRHGRQTRFRCGPAMRNAPAANNLALPPPRGAGPALGSTFLESIGCSDPLQEGADARAALGCDQCGLAAAPC